MAHTSRSARGSHHSPQSAHADQGPPPTNVGLQTFTATTVSTSTSTAAIARNPARAALLIQNEGAVAVVCKPGSVPANATDGLVLIAGASFQMTPTPVDALYCQSASATAKIVFMEFTK